jgi:hypothetical protein
MVCQVCVKFCAYEFFTRYLLLLVLCVTPFGKAFVADSDAGRGCRKKRKLHCNDADTIVDE